MVVNGLIVRFGELVEPVTQELDATAKIGRGIDRTSGIWQGHVGGGEDEVTAGRIGCYDDIVQNGDSQEGLHIRIVRLGLERVPEEHKHVNRLLCDRCPDLLIPAHGTA